jgi:hypothetical protein
MKMILTIALLYLLLVLGALGTFTLYLYSEYKINKFELIEMEKKYDS